MVFVFPVGRFCSQEENENTAKTLPVLFFRSRKTKKSVRGRHSGRAAHEKKRPTHISARIDSSIPLRLRFQPQSRALLKFTSLPFLLATCLLVREASHRGLEIASLIYLLNFLHIRFQFQLIALFFEAESLISTWLMLQRAFWWKFCTYNDEPAIIHPRERRKSQQHCSDEAKNTSSDSQPISAQRRKILWRYLQIMTKIRQKSL